MADAEANGRDRKDTARSAPVLLLAGVGHGHLFVLEALARGELPPVRPVLVAPSDDYYYSGMVSGVVAGRYPREAPLLRASHLARAAGAEWVQAAVTRVDPDGKTVVLDDGRSIAYDLLSLSIGSRLQAEKIAGGSEHGVPIKPFGHSLDLGARAAELVEGAGAGRTVRIAVVGGGAAGWEIGVCLEAALSRRFPAGRYRVTLVHEGDQVLAEHPPRVRRKAARLLRERGIEARGRTKVAEAGPAEVVAEGGDRIPYDLLVWATGPRAPSLIVDSGLPTDPAGYMLVEPSLRAKGSDSVFGAGDCVTIQGYPWVPKAGVYAVREGGVLTRNLARQLRGEPLEDYKPQEAWLSLMNTGDGRALLSYRGIAAHAHAAWWLKDQIDRRFVERFRSL